MARSPRKQHLTEAPLHCTLQSRYEVRSARCMAGRRGLAEGGALHCTAVFLACFRCPRRSFKGPDFPMLFLINRKSPDTDWHHEISRAWQQNCGFPAAPVLSQKEMKAETGERSIAASTQRTQDTRRQPTNKQTQANGNTPEDPTSWHRHCHCQSNSQQ